MILEFLAQFVVNAVFTFAAVSRPRGVTRMRGSLEEMTRRLPRSTVRRAELVEGWAPTDDLASVEFVVAARRGLSFHDGYGHQELHFAADAVARLDLLSAAGDDGQHLAAMSGDTTLVEFWCPDSAGDAQADLTAALRG